MYSYYKYKNSNIISQVVTFELKEERLKNMKFSLLILQFIKEVIYIYLKYQQNIIDTCICVIDWEQNKCIRKIIY